MRGEGDAMSRDAEGGGHAPGRAQGVSCTGEGTMTRYAGGDAMHRDAQGDAMLPRRCHTTGRPGGRPLHNNILPPILPGFHLCTADVNGFNAFTICGIVALVGDAPLGVPVLFQ